MTRVLVALPLWVVAAGAAPAGESRLVRLDRTTGKLVYTPDERGDRIPDFSNAGYGGGGVALPDVPARQTLSPEPGAGDDGERIQAAIDAVARRPVGDDGFRGAVLLKRGAYRVAGTLEIKTSGVVLRGENGTVIVATGRKKRTLIRVGARARVREVKGTRRAIVGDYAPVGARELTLASADGLKVGDRIVVYRPSTKDWIHDIGMDRIPGAKVQWRPGSYNFRFERVVRAVSGAAITLDAPVVNAIQARYGGGAVYKYTCPERISHVGVERLRLVSEYEKGKERSDEDHAWDAVELTGVEHAWVRNVTAVHFGYSCVNVRSGGKHITIQDCACLDPVSKVSGGRRYSFALAGQLTLVQRCYARHGRHDFVMHSRACGPNVFLDCVAEQAHSDSGPHHRWSMATLYDNVTVQGNALNVRDRGKSGTGHGWAGSQMVFWNCTAKSITCQRPPTSQNYCIGCVGKRRDGRPKRPEGHWESVGRAVRPRSLYLKQLEDRLGRQAVSAVATPAQRCGPISRLLTTNLSK